MKLTDIITGPQMAPPRICIYGGAGVGKSTFAASAPKAVFLCTEDGAGIIGVDRFPLLDTYDAFVSAIDTLTNEDHEFRTVVIDSLDWLEPVIWQKVCDIHGFKSIEDPGYGKGYVFAVELWRDVLARIEVLRKQKNMAVIMIAHSAIRKYEAPDQDAYDRFELKLHKKSADLVSEHSDIIGYCDYRTMMKESDAGFGRTRTRAVGTGERVLRTGAQPAFVAKSRYPIPVELPLEWSALMAAITGEKK